MIADRFTGSGGDLAGNVIFTSAAYNQTDMGNAEDSILPGTVAVVGRVGSTDYLPRRGDTVIGKANADDDHYLTLEAG